MKILSSLLVLFTFFLLSSCNSNLDIHLLSQDQKVVQDKYFSTVDASYNLNNNQLDFSLMKDSSKTKYPAAVVACHFSKDSNPTDLCSTLAPNLNTDNVGHFTWNTNYTENGSYFFTITSTFNGNMFAGLLQLSSLDLSTFDTSAVVEMDSLFSGANIPKVLLQGYTTANPAKASWDTTNVTNPTGVFSNSASINTYCTGTILTRACDFDPATF